MSTPAPASVQRAVAAAHHLAAAAGLAALGRGGNAPDAAVTAAVCAFTILGERLADSDRAPGR